jgi:thiamine pyrophosphate-dependent acetolactate synthase large subunit-like protein
MMTQRQALDPIAAVRGQQIVVTTMSASGIWPSISDTPLDFAYIPSSMGQGISLGLGLALARPHRGVIAVMGDGSLLMNLGSLVTVANHPAPLHVVLLDNGLYEVTGGQPVAGAGKTDFAGLARAAGIERVYAFDELVQWTAAAGEALTGSDASFVLLKVEARKGQKTPAPPRPMAEQIRRLEAALNAGSFRTTDNG